MVQWLAPMTVGSEPPVTPALGVQAETWHILTQTNINSLNLLKAEETRVGAPWPQHLWAWRIRSAHLYSLRNCLGDLIMLFPPYVLYPVACGYALMFLCPNVSLNL